MTHWYDYVFWLFAGGVCAWILFIWIRMALPQKEPPRSSAPLPKKGDDTTYSLESSTDSGTEMSSSDSGGWND